MSSAASASVLWSFVSNARFQRLIRQRKTRPRKAAFCLHTNPHSSLSDLLGSYVIA